MNAKSAVQVSLFQRVMGSAFQQLAPALQAAHQPGDALMLSGQSIVRRGSGLLARMLCVVLGFPEAGEGVAVSVHMQKHGAGECWQRCFGARRFESTFSAGSGSTQGLLREQFGPLRFHIALQVVDGALHWAVQGGTLWGIPLPAFLLPRGDSREYELEGRFHFHVEIGHPLTGLVVHYQGWLEPR